MHLTRRDRVCAFCLAIQVVVFAILHFKLERVQDLNINLVSDFYDEQTAAPHKHHHHRRTRKHQESHLTERTDPIAPPKPLIPPPADGEFSLDYEIQQAQAQLATLTNVGGPSPLKFFHIPKTAGTAIEHAAAAARQMVWGSCLFNHKPKRDICRYIYPGKEWPGHHGWWHLPTWLFPMMNVDPYMNADTFAVTRDPYDRVVSEYYYICSLKVKEWRTDQCDNRTRLHDAAYMNDWLRRKLQQGQHDAEHGNTTVQNSKQLLSTYLQDNGHFTPQYDYLVGPHQVRMIDHVLDLAHIDTQFAALMQHYGLPDVTLVKMNAISASESRSSNGTHLNVPDLDAATLRAIHARYPDDFDRLGYARKNDVAT